MPPTQCQVSIQLIVKKLSCAQLPGTHGAALRNACAGHCYRGGWGSMQNLQLRVGLRWNKNHEEWQELNMWCGFLKVSYFQRTLFMTATFAFIIGSFAWPVEPISDSDHAETFVRHPCCEEEAAKNPEWLTFQQGLDEPPTQDHEAEAAGLVAFWFALSSRPFGFLPHHGVIWLCWHL